MGGSLRSHGSQPSSQASRACIRVPLDRARGVLRSCWDACRARFVVESTGEGGDDGCCAGGPRSALSSWVRSSSHSRALCTELHTLLLHMRFFFGALGRARGRVESAQPCTPLGDSTWDEHPARAVGAARANVLHGCVSHAVKAERGRETATQRILHPRGSVVWRPATWASFGTRPAGAAGTAPQRRNAV